MAFAISLPLTARASDAGLEKLNGSQVAYRLQGVALIKDSKGTTVEQSLADAPLGAGDHIRYLVVATNQGSKPQTAGISITIPEYTVWEPPHAVEEADIIEWTADGSAWRSGRPPDPAKVRRIRWAFADALMPRMSTAFAFELRLTGPYSDRTGDLNATQSPNVRPLVALAAQEVASIQTVHHADKPSQNGPGSTDPLAIGALLNNPKSVVDFNGVKMVEVAVRDEVDYRATGTATVRAPNGETRSVPVSQTRLGIGDRVTYAFLAQNVGDVTRMAGATFVIPTYARFNSAATRGDGIIETTDDFVHWTKPSKMAPEKVRGIRWAYDGKLNARESAAFQVIVDVVGAPDTEDLNSPGGSGVFEALSPSMIQSVKFTNELSASAANTSRDIANQIASIGDAYDGVPITSKLADSVAQYVQPGVVKSDATPVPTAVPLAAQPKASTGPDVDMIGLFVGGGILMLVCFLFSQANGSSDPGARRDGGGRGSFRSERARGEQKIKTDLTGSPRTR